jgi:hypothetical protein
MDDVREIPVIKITVSNSLTLEQRLEICALQGYYAAWNGNILSTFRDNVWVPSSRVKKSKKKRLGLLDS